MPNRTTRDYESPTLAPHLQAALDTALKDEDDIEVDEPYVANNIFLIYFCEQKLLKFFFFFQRSHEIKPKK